MTTTKNDLKLGTPLELPCGEIIRNRLFKAAMSESLADPYGRPTIKLQNIYLKWGEFGAGILISGNVMVDDCHLEDAGNMRIEKYFEDEEMKAAYRELAKVSQKNGSATWLQLGHAGRQSQEAVNINPKGPSNIPCKARTHKHSKPVKMTKEDIEDVVQKFRNAALATKDAGFRGLQLHAAHGYLFSSFLNPLVNNRKDEFGGSLENRAKILLMTVKAVREAVGPKYPVGVKLNSADYQEGGATIEDAVEVAKMLDKAGVDLLEISGGNYENMIMVLGREGNNKPKSTQEREAYYLEYADRVAKELSHTKLMMTGGFRSKVTIEYALNECNVDAVGLGRPFFYTNYLCTKMINGELEAFPSPETDLSNIPWFLKPLKLVMNPYILAKYMSFKYTGNLSFLCKNEEMDESGINVSAKFYQNSRKEALANLKGVTSIGTVHNAPSSMSKSALPLSLLVAAAGVSLALFLYKK